MQRYDFSKKLKFIILAAGYGKRWQPLSLIIPKCCLPFLNYPFIDFILSYLKNVSAFNIYFNLYHLGEKIKESLKKYEGIFNLNYSEEDHLLGTAGGIKRIFDLYGESEAIIINSDSFVPLSFNSFYRFHKKNKADITLCLKKFYPNKNYTKVFLNEKGEIFLDNKNLYFQQAYNFCGIYLMNPLSIIHIKKNKYADFTNEVLKKNTLKKRILGYKTRKIWLDIGTPKSYIESSKIALEKIISSKNLPVWLPDRFMEENKIVKLKQGILLLKNTAKIIANEIKGIVVAGEKCYIRGNSALENCIIMDEAIIEENVFLKNCIVGFSTRIPSHCHYENKIILSASLLSNIDVSAFQRDEENILQNLI